MNRLLAIIALTLATADLSAATERIFRPARNTRGNTNTVKIQPIDYASWIWHPEDLAMSGGASAITHDAQTQRDVAPVMIFEKEFEVKEGEKPFEIDVSADERFYLTLDGEFVARGPNRADLNNWQYNTYKVTLKPGKHVFRAVVTRLGNHAPLAQLSYRGGFVLKASGEYDERLTTGKAKWNVAWWKGMKPAGADDGVWGTGSQFEITGSYPAATSNLQPSTFNLQPAVVVRGPAGHDSYPCWGGHTPGWMLFPSQLPDQMEAPVKPGEFRAATHAAGWRANHVYTEAETKDPLVDEFNARLKGAKMRTIIPANTKVQLAWHLGRYICAYPVLKTKGGEGARVSWNWTESPRDAETKRKAQRNEIVGNFLQGYGDTFVMTGGEEAFSTPWFRCGLWCRLDIETKDAPLEITDLTLIENRYPVEMESSFASTDDASLQDIRRICARAMQMCCHEMLFDCPFYEQQMYPGDTRVQLLVLSALSRDDRIIKRAMEIYDYATRDDGQCPFNYPTRGTQEGFTYTQCYLLMFGDYAMNHADREWLRCRLPGMRKSMSGCELYENEEGLLDNTPGWNFQDWTTEWHDSAVPGSHNGHRINSFANMMWLLDMQSAAKVERALGNEFQAKYWEAKAEKLKAAIIAKFWDAKRSLIADTPEKKTYSEHCQAMAILGDLLPKAETDAMFKHLVEDSDLARTTVYFSYYLFEAYFKMGRADLFQKRLDLWRGYVAKGITTLSEAPDSGKNGQSEARSDCHAWGAHPIWFMQTGFAGISSAAPWFERVRIAPQPGTLKDLKCRHPHPKGWIDVDLKFDGGFMKGIVSTPVPGTIVYGGQSLELEPGTTVISLP